nr:hypothetical protein [Nostoc sp. DedQUE03]MDZ7976453.1 hypothetical protein [Nostoc sp. DedQUE03]MDZ8042776.1 hypothetical protein [Nostoc sp. DedQUE02]
MQGEWNIGLQYSGLWSARRGGENLIIDLQTRLESNSPSSNDLAERSARSLTDTIAAIVPQRGDEFGATASHSLSDPHSSAST